MKRIRISTPNVTAFATLNDTPTAQAIWDALPIEAHAETWGDEIYFGIPMECVEETGAREVLALGELGYWPPGSAFCIFFGRTPASQGNEIRAASAVNVIGHIEGDPKVFKPVRSGAVIRIERRES